MRKINQHIRTAFALPVFLILLPGNRMASAQSVFPPPSLSMSQYVSDVLATHPGVAAREAGRDAGQFRIPPAGALPDPTLGLGVMNLPLGSFSFGQMDMTMKTLSVSQMFPAPGVRDARTTVMERALEVSEMEIAVTREMLTLQARRFYLELYDIEQALMIVTENRALLDTFIRISEARYRIGDGIQQDILKARLEHARLAERLIRLEARQAGLRSTMNILRGIPAEAGFNLAGLPEPVEQIPGAAELLELARTGNPAMLKSSTMIEQREAAHLLAERLRRPAWSAATSYAQRDGGRSDLISASVMVQIPLWAGSKQTLAVEEQDALLREARYRQQEIELGLSNSIHRLRASFEESRRLIRLYASEIVPEAEGVLHSALAGYRVGQVDFLTLLNAQATLFSYQLESIRVMTDYHRHMVELEATIGTPIPEDLNAEQAGKGS